MLVDAGGLVDVVVVHHNDRNRSLFVELVVTLAELEPTIPFRVIDIDNSVHNRGFAKGCNTGAYQGNAPVIAFLNPDIKIDGPIFEKALAALEGDVVITGARFGKPATHLAEWGCDDWVCGACFFVRRDWFDRLGGFDEQYVWGWEETDMIRKTQAAGLRARSIPLPVRHEDVAAHLDPDPVDQAYKAKWFEHGKAIFKDRWLTG